VKPVFLLGGRRKIEEKGELGIGGDGTQRAKEGSDIFGGPRGFIEAVARPNGSFTLVMLALRLRVCGRFTVLWARCGLLWRRGRGRAAEYFRTMLSES